MRLFSSAKTIFRTLIYSEDETPRILRHIYDLIDEDLDLDNEKPRHPVSPKFGRRPIEEFDGPNSPARQGST